MTKKRVLLGMSGGVDSSMSAWYLLQQGYEVVGITFNTLAPLSSPESLYFISEAKALAQKLDFVHHTIDVYDAFKSDVIDYFVDEYLKGRTPNPCIRCNETIKWKLLLEESERLGCEYIATGHYVSTIEKDGFFHIQKGKDPSKDQSYFLWNLSQSILKKCVFPLDSMIKKEVKEKADSLGFKSMANKKESMGVCFLQGNDYRNFINELKPDLQKHLSNGEIRNSKGENIGTHEGFPYYTIGQKRGLNLTNNQGEYVACIDAKNNRLITAPKKELLSSQVIISDFMFCNPSHTYEKQEVDLRIRGLDAVPPTPGTLELIKGKLHITFNQAVWALTPGQSIVFYKDDVVMGGGIVDDFEYDNIELMND